MLHKSIQNNFFNKPIYHLLIKLNKKLLRFFFNMMHLQQNAYIYSKKFDSFEEIINFYI